MAYALVRFTDGIYHVTCDKKIIKKGIRASVSWKGTSYEADILDKSKSKEFLLNLKEEYEQSKFYLII